MCPERDKLFNYSGLDLLAKTLSDPYPFTRTYRVCAGNVFRDCPSSRYARKTEQTAMGKKSSMIY